MFNQTIYTTDTLQYDSIHAGQTAWFIFKNISETTPVTFWNYQEKGINYYNALTMLSSAIDSSMTDEEKARAIWKLCMISGHHYEYDYNHRLQDNVDPISLVTFPYFMCGEKAGIVANLAAIAGLPSRTISLDGHVVPEIKYDNAWHLFDADESCIFRNHAGQIASVEELHRYPELISSEHIEHGIKSDFPGFNRYKEFVRSYEPDRIDTSLLIANYQFPNNAITLYPNDEVSFQLHPNSWWTQLRFPRYLCETQGLLKRKINVHQANVYLTDTNLISLHEHFPYYLKLLKIHASLPLNTKVFFQCQNRETLMVEKIYLGNLREVSLLLKKFGAPVMSDIYYEYNLIFENLSANDADKITIEHEFEFNALTFPLHKNGNKVIITDSIGKKMLQYQIYSEAK